MFLLFTKPKTKTNNAGYEMWRREEKQEVKLQEQCLYFYTLSVCTDIAGTSALRNYLS